MGIRYLPGIVTTSHPATNSQKYLLVNGIDGTICHIPTCLAGILESNPHKARLAPTSPY
jgi:hypothetical protein